MTKQSNVYIVAALLLSASIGLSGCDDSEVGVCCKIDESDPDCRNPTAPPVVGSDLNSTSLDCRSRLCILYAFDAPQEAQPMCTRSCNSDSDCPSDALGVCPPDPQGGRSFVCRIGTTTQGGLQCCKMCVCSAWVADLTDDPLEGACQGIETGNCSAF